MNKMFLTFLCIIVSLLLVSSTSAQSDRAQIQDVLVKFKAALSSRNPENAVRYTDSATLAYYDSLIPDVQQADSVALAALPLFRRLVVVSFRHRDTGAIIRHYTGKKLLAFAIDNDMVSDGNIIGDSIGIVVVNGARARAMTYFTEDGDSLQLHLVKAHGRWKVNLVAEMDAAAGVVGQLHRDSGKPEAAFIIGLLENMTGRAPTSAIWRKPE